jgi:radical SAM protein with 4Fe4S-binding SPASM domain
MSFKQDAPFSIQIELTTGCNLQCTFCGINGFQEKPNKNLTFMSLETAEILATQIADSGWNSRLELAMHGEPTMNPHWIEIVGILRDKLPNHQIMVTSNGGGIVSSKDIQGTVSSYFSNGGNILAIDEYEKVNFVKRIRAGIDDFELEEQGVKVYNYPEDKDGNPHKRTKGKFLSFIAPINLSDKGTHADLNNHCGSGGELNNSASTSLCAKPFRELSINADGSINLCCNDFIGEYTCGSILNSNIEDIWNGDYFNSARKFLMDRQRDAIRPCRGCDAKSYRVGLLPDKMGKVTMEKPTEKDLAICLEALSDGPDRGPTERAKKNIIPTLTIDEEMNWL